MGDAIGRDKPNGVSRRGVMQCLTWAGTGLV
jgi:hypothetical protein